MNIFWGTSWATYSGDKMTGMDTFCKGFGNSNLAKTVDEYTGSNGQVGPASTHQGYVIDSTTASRGDDPNVIMDEVCKMIPNPDPSGNGFYSVFVDLPRNGDDYCAWHSSGTCNGVQVQFGFFWMQEGDSGCDPKSKVSGQSQGLAALANVYGHEICEARTDPNGDAWIDGQGEEVGDMCAWAFHSPYVTFTDGTQWKVQGMWSNKAYLAGTGYPNLSGQAGCVQGS